MVLLEFVFSSACVALVLVVRLGHGPTAAVAAAPVIAIAARPSDVHLRPSKDTCTLALYSVSVRYRLVCSRVCLGVPGVRDGGPLLFHAGGLHGEGKEVCPPLGYDCRTTFVCV